MSRHCRQRLFAERVGGHTNQNPHACAALVQRGVVGPSGELWQRHVGVSQGGAGAGGTQKGVT